MNDTGAAGAGGFNQKRPPNLIRLPWWNRLAYITRALPATLEVMIGDLRVPPSGRVLDYGCANMPYRRCFPPEARYSGADLAGNPDASLTINSDGSVPVDSNSFDAVLSSQVLEHVADPALYLSECYRVLRPGGRLLLSTHGMMVYHPDPVDYWRWTGSGLRRQVEMAGFKVERFVGVMDLTATGLQLVQDGTWLRVPRVLRPSYSLLMQGLIALSDRLTSDQSREFNALVFALIAEKPASDGQKIASPAHE